MNYKTRRGCKINKAKYDWIAEEWKYMKKMHEAFVEMASF